MRERLEVKLMGKTTIVIMLILVVGTGVWGDPSNLNYRKRGDQQWQLSFGTGKNYRIPRGTSVPHQEFSIATVEFEKFTSSRTSLGYQLSLANQTNNGNNNAVALLSNYRRYFLVHGRFSADYKLGIGVMHLNNALPGQATRSNFNEQLGVAIQYAASSNSAIALEYTLYHASNAGIERPNDGITATIVTAGYCWRG